MYIDKHNNRYGLPYMISNVNSISSVAGDATKSIVGHIRSLLSSSTSASRAATPSAALPPAWAGGQSPLKRVYSSMDTKRRLHREAKEQIVRYWRTISGLRKRRGSSSYGQLELDHHHDHDSSRQSQNLHKHKVGDKNKRKPGEVNRHDFPLTDENEDEQYGISRGQLSVAEARASFCALPSIDWCFVQCSKMQCCNAAPECRMGSKVLTCVCLCIGLRVDCFLLLGIWLLLLLLLFFFLLFPCR